MHTPLRLVTGAALAATLSVIAACAPPPQNTVRYDRGGYSQPQRCNQCGTVDDVQQIYVEKGASPLGMILGAVVGGVAGSTIGKGDGRTATTVVGAVAGGAVGNQVGKRSGQDVAYQVRVRLEDGRGAVVTQRDDPQVRRGDYVEIRGEKVYRR
jgi:outer membrane lipoprotein SlyB